MNSGKLSLKDIRADLLGGHHAGNWDADFTASPPKYFGSGTVTKLAMAQVCGLDARSLGYRNLGRSVHSGNGRSRLRPRCVIPQPGLPAFKWTGGSLRHVVLEGKGTPLSFSSFGGQVALRNGSLSCEALQAAIRRRNVST